MAVLEWLTRGLRQLNVIVTLQECVEIVTLENHKVTLPKNIKYLTQVVYKTGNSTTDTSELMLPENSNLTDQLNKIYSIG